MAIIMQEIKKLAKKVDAIQKDLEFLKVSVAKGSQVKPKKVVSLKGVIKGVKIEDSDVRGAKRSILKSRINSL